MTTMNRQRTAARRELGRFRPIMDGLEARLAMAQLGPTIDLPVSVGAPQASGTLQVDGFGDGSTSVSLASSPATIEVGFHQPVGLLGQAGRDFGLRVVAPDGSTSTQAGIGLGGNESIDRSDATLSEVDLAVQSALPAGEYQLVLFGSSPLVNLLPSGSGPADADRVIADFTVGSRTPATSGAPTDRSLFGQETGTASTGQASAPAPTPVAAQATVIQGISLVAADPESASATGLTLLLSGPISATGLTGPSGPSIQLLDASGRAWTLTLTGYDAAKEQVSFAFDQDLPAGDYSLVDGPGGGLVDAGGRPVVAAGPASVVLGQFVEVAATPNPDDFGTLAPAATSGRTSSLAIAADGTASAEFVVLVPGFYSFSAGQGAASYSLQAVQGGASVPTAAQGLDPFLAAGVYRMDWTGLDPSAGSVPVTVLRKSSADSSLLGEGLGQAPLQGTKLLASTPGASGSVATSAADPGRSGSGDNATSGAAPAANSSGPASMPVGSFTVVGQPVGRPSLHSDQISVVTSTGSQGSIAVASNGPNLPSGLMPRLSPGRTRREPIPEAAGGASLPSISVEQEPVAPAPGAGSPADRAIAATDRADTLDRHLELALEATEFPGPPSEQGPAEIIEDELAGSAEELVEAERPIVAMASFASPVGLVVATVVAIQYRRSRKSKARVSAVPSSLPHPFRGPHLPGRMLPQARQATR